MHTSLSHTHTGFVQDSQIQAAPHPHPPQTKKKRKEKKKAAITAVFKTEAFPKVIKCKLPEKLLRVLVIPSISVDGARNAALLEILF